MGIALKANSGNLALGAQDGNLKLGVTGVRPIEEVFVGDELPTEDRGYKIWIEPGEPIDEVVTKENLEQALENIDLDNYYTKSEIDNKFENVEAEPEIFVGSEFPEESAALLWIEPEGTEGDSIATEEYVNNAVASIDLSGYATKEEIPDTSAFQTEDDVKSLIDLALGEVENGTY